MMEHFVTWLEATQLSLTLRDSLLLWPTCETLHFMGLTFLIGGAGFLDLRLLGAFSSVPIKSVKAFMPYAIAGFVVNLITGGLFLIISPRMYLLSGIWWFKVFFIVLAGLNAMVFETRLGKEALALMPGQDTPAKLKMVGAVSLISWFAVLYCGRMLPYLGSGN